MAIWKAAGIGGMDEGERARMTVSLSLISHPFQNGKSKICNAFGGVHIGE